MAAFTPNGKRFIPAVIQANTPTQDTTTGEYLDSYSDWQSIYIYLEPLTSIGANLNLTLTDTIAPVRYYNGVMRYIPGLSIQHQIRIGSRILTVKAFVDVGELHQWINLSLSEYLR